MFDDSSPTSRNELEHSGCAVHEGRTYLVDKGDELLIHDEKNEPIL
jgi:hypothetical protein